MKSIFFLLALLFLNVLSQSITCSDYSTCADCVDAQTLGECGWCASTSSCVGGNSDGDFNGICNKQNWIYGGASSILQTTTGFPVSPVHFDVYLYPNSELDLFVTVTNPVSDAVPLDLYIIEDLSGSMADDVATFQALSRELTVDVLRYQSNPRFGLGSFIEKPIFPFGLSNNTDQGNTFDWSNGATEITALSQNALAPCPTRLADSGPWNWAFCHEQDISSNYNLLTDAVNTLVNHVNEDWPENQLEALMYAAVCPMGWREGARRVVLVATDADYQVPVTVGGTHTDAGGDTWNVPFTRDNDYLCTQDIGSNGLPGTEENFPDPAEVAKLVAAANIVPIIASANVPPEHQDFPTWERLLNGWGFGSVLELDSDSSNLIELVRQALEEVATAMVMSLSTDPANQVLSWDPPAGYPNVPAGDQRYFTITLLDDQGTVEEEFITFTVVGFGEVTIQVFNQIPCTGCDGGSDPSVVVDLCGVCDGNDDCVGCDYQPYSNTVYDSCGICDGDGTSCIDCERTPWGDKVNDACLVCGGDNATCRGCDDKVYPVESGEVPLGFDNCGVCGGDDDCRGCDGLLRSNKTVDICGVCGGNNLTCVFVKPPPPSKVPEIVGIAAGAIVLAVLLVLAVIFILGLLAKKKWDEYQYMNNQAMTSLGSSPLYEETGGWQNNQL